jgi:hypothetical protein
MSSEEERLARLLKRAVPEPPVQLSADEITTQSARPSARSWRLPALAAAAVAAIGVTVGLVAAQLPSSRGAAVPLSVSGSSARPSPQVGATCQGRTVTVPNVVGETMDAAGAVIQDAGLNQGVYFAPSTREPAGIVLAESPTAGGRAVPGALIWLTIASAPSTSTAAPIDPGWEPTAPPATPSPCQVVTGTPAAADATRSVPNLVGMGSNQAIRNAQADGFTVTKVVTAAAASRPVPPGMVFAQVPVAGSRARPGSGIFLYVAPGS